MSENICPVCEKRPIAPGDVCCSQCRRQYLLSTSIRDKIRELEDAEYRTEYRKRSENRCPVCGKHFIVPGDVCCSQCRSQYNFDPFTREKIRKLEDARHHKIMMETDPEYRLAYDKKEAKSDLEFSKENLRRSIYGCILLLLLFAGWFLMFFRLSTEIEEDNTYMFLLLCLIAFMGLLVFWAKDVYKTMMDVIEDYKSDKKKWEELNNR